MSGSLLFFFLRLPQLSSGYKACLVLVYKLSIHGAILLQKQVKFISWSGRPYREWNESLEAIIRPSSYLSICSSPSLIISPTIQHKIPSQKLQAKFFLSTLSRVSFISLSAIHHPSYLSCTKFLHKNSKLSSFSTICKSVIISLSLWNSPSLITSPAVVLYQIHSQKLHSPYHFLHASNYTTATHHHHHHLH